MENIACHEDEFFILLQRVGTKGKYQKNIFLLFFGLWFITAFLILGVAFLLLPNKFTCPSIASQAECNRYVCSLPESEWPRYEQPPLLNSLLTEMGSYHCQYESKIATEKMMLFLGIFVGYLIFMHFSDNFGRRFGMVLTWSTAVAGLALISLSRNTLTATLGLLLAGAGCESNMRINLAILNEIVDYRLRQKYSLILQCSFGIAGVFVSLGYYYLRDWRQVTTLFCTLPAFLLLLVIVFYLEDTPNYLAKRGSRALLRSLQTIAAVNGFECTVSEQDVVRVMDLKRELQLSSKKVHFSIRDLFHYKSLKSNTLNLAVIFFFLSSLYIGPNSAIDQFQIDIFLLQVILSISDCIAYPIACYFIADTQRKTIGIKCFVMSAVFNLAASFLNNPQGCVLCFSDIAKLTLMFCSRYCVSYYYGVLFIYVVEIYPEQIRTIGFGTVSAVGALGAMATQKIMQFATDHNHDLLLYLALFSVVCLFFIGRLPETQGQPLQVEIDELKKEKIKQRYQPSLEQSFDGQQFPSDGSESHRSTSITTVELDK